MIKFSINKFQLNIQMNRRNLDVIQAFFEAHLKTIILISLIAISIASFWYFYSNGLGLAYNDARSRLDIGRRVVEGLKPGFAQLGSVWLPLIHILMVPTVWNDWMWHSGLSGGLVSMISFVITGFAIFQFLKLFKVGLLGRIIGVLIFVLNINILYLQSTAMTELLLLATTTLGAYYIAKWFQNELILDLIKAAFWIMLATATRYDGWFTFAFTVALICSYAWKKYGYKRSEGVFFLFCTLGGLGIVMWFLWNQLIFKDALYFAFGEFSAHAQQTQLEEAGVLSTKNNIWFSLKVYLYALFYNSNTFLVLLGLAGAIYLWFDKKLSIGLKIASLSLIAPFIFNIIALYLGHSVLFIQGLSGDTWFNARYGIMLAPSIAIFIGILIDRLSSLRMLLIGLIALVTFFTFSGQDAVTIDDARVGSSQKNVSEVSGWLKDNATNQPGFILISAASHDAIIFSSGLPMKRFIHEGTGDYWKSAVSTPDRWARWIVVRTYDNNDLTWRTVNEFTNLDKYDKVAAYPFADVYQLKPEFLPNLITEPVLPKQK